MTRKHFTEMTLAGLVLILVASNFTLATKVNSLRLTQNDLLTQSTLAAIETQSKISRPRIQSITPEYGPIGTQVTITGTGFSTQSGNTIMMDYGIAASVISPDGKTLSFIVPKYLTVVCKSLGACPTNSWQEVVPKSYNIGIRYGERTSNSLKFMVTASQISDSVKIAALKPNSGKVGTTVTVTGKGFAAKNNTVLFGYHQITNIPSTNNGQSLKFVVPKNLTYPCLTGTPCPTSLDRSTAPGQYAVRVTNGTATSNEAIFTVRPSGR